MNIEDLRETAGLARLNLDEGELGAAFPAFEQMLGFFAAMQAADQDPGAFPGEKSAAPAAAAACFRPDAAPALGETAVSPLIDNSGERDGPFIVVPNVL